MHFVGKRFFHFSSIGTPAVETLRGVERLIESLSRAYEVDRQFCQNAQFRKRGAPHCHQITRRVTGLASRIPIRDPLQNEVLPTALAMSNTVHGKYQGMQQNGEIHKEAPMADI